LATSALVASQCAFVDEDLQYASSRLSTPQIAVQAASPLTQSPASNDDDDVVESDDDDRQRSAVDVIQTSALEDQERDSTAGVPGLEMDFRDFRGLFCSVFSLEMDSWHSVGFAGPVPGLKMDSEDVRSDAADGDVTDDDQRVPDDDDDGEEPVEGRLSADTAEQIFISQQIDEARTITSDERQPPPGETTLITF